MLRIWSRYLVAVCLFLIVASCSGGGCSSGCSSCGTQPIPGGFPKAQTVANAAAVRVTRPGLDFIGQNLSSVVKKVMNNPSGVLEFPIPQSTSNFDIKDPIFGATIGSMNIHICDGGPKPNENPPKCIAQIKIGDAKLRIDAITPSAVKIAGTIPVKLGDLPIRTERTSGVGISTTFEVGAGNGGCNGGTPQFDYKEFPVLVELPLIAETKAPRDGYTKIDVQNAKIDIGIAEDDVAICKDCGFFTFGCNALFGLIKGFAFNSLIGGVKGQLVGVLESNLCTKPNPALTPACPTGSQPNNNDVTKADKCVYASDPNACVPTMLGIDGRMDLSSALASISPGTAGGLDFVLAAGGAMNPAPGAPMNGQGQTPNGITLSMLGGTAPRPLTSCVPIAENPPPTGIPVPDEMIKDTQTPWPAGVTGPHLGIALAGRFLNYAFTSVYNSGLLCLGISTETAQQLNSGTLSLLAGSMKKLTMEQKPAAAAITTRPQAAPKIKVGGGTNIKTDPLLTIDLPKFAIDFYIFSTDRFVRAFTLTADVTVPVNLQTAKDAKNPNGGILPTIGDLTVKNPVISNADLITDDPVALANGISGLLGGLVGQFIGGGISPIDVSSMLSSLGLTLDIPNTGIRKITKGSDDFIAIFANLGVKQGTALAEVDTKARLLKKEVHPEAMTLKGANRALFPKLHMRFDSPEDNGTKAVEYSYWIDEATHSPWSRERDVVIDNDYLFLQGKHTLKVAARYADDTASEDSTPAEIPFTIDVMPPEVFLDGKGEGIAVRAWDFVSSDEALVGRYRLDQGAYSEWMPLSKLGAISAGESRSIEVEVKDEEGNVGYTQQGLIRGRPDATLKAAGSGCGCSTPGQTGNMHLAWIAGLAGLSLLVWRRKGVSAKRSTFRLTKVALGLVGVVAATSQGCACGSEGGAVALGCGQDCNQECGPPLQIGLVGAYTSVTKAKDGSVWVAGYNDADLNGGSNWGDLVVGRYDSGKNQVIWQTVDGVPGRPDGTCPTNDRAGWRGGEVEPGDNVGLWTSIAMSSGDQPMVAYYDVTNYALKFAAMVDGAWVVHTIRKAPQSDIGRYAKMIIQNGNPVVAFLLMEKGKEGKVRSKVVLAKAKVAVPRADADWTFEDVAVDENGPCRLRFCDTGQVCVKATGVCQPKATGCTPSPCPAGSIGAAGQECVTIDKKATCSEIINDTYIDTYPSALGVYISLAQGPNGLGIVVYDRIHGNLVGLFNAGGKWTAAVLDGETGSRQNNTAVDTGDVGVGASLAIAPNGDWHVSYVNGFTESLQYLVVPQGKAPTAPLKPEIVDDGRTADGKPSPDGTHIVGDDSSISVDGNGAVTIVYQDATAGVLRVATGAPATGGTHKWTVKAIPQPGRFAGFFPSRIPGETKFVNWYREIKKDTKEIFGDVAFVAP